MKKLISAILLTLIFIPNSITADEGMWLPFLLKSQKYKDMRKMGLKLPANALYSDSDPSIAQAVVGFMGEGAN